jgi:hypothetical protein
VRVDSQQAVAVIRAPVCCGTGRARREGAAACVRRVSGRGRGALLVGKWDQ